MKFNIKTAMKYSSNLKNLISSVQESLGVYQTLIPNYTNYSGNDNTPIYSPAAANGVYTVKINAKKSAVNTIAGTNLTDEEETLEAKGDFAKISPDKRIEILNDLLNERANIDYLIEKVKNESKYTDEFTGKEVTYDLGCQINAMYRNCSEMVIKPLVEMDTELKASAVGKINVLSNSDDKNAINVTYPIEVTATSNVNSEKILKLYDSICEKCNLNSAQLSAIEISKFFDYEPKFNVNNLTVKSIIEQYKDKE